MSKGFITIATGDEQYYRIAYNLLLSYRAFSKDPVPFALLCDRENEYTAQFDQVIIMEHPYRSYLDKLRFPLYTPFDETIFIDADCLAYRDLNDFWDSFAGGSYFSVFGEDLPVDYAYGWFKPEDMGEFKDRIHIIPEFIGGVYYVRKCPELTEFMNTVDYVHEHYYDYRFRQFTDPCDEPVFALSLAAHGLHTAGNRTLDICFYPHNTYFKADISEQSIAYRDVYHPERGLITDSWMIHWGSGNTRRPRYKLEVYRLNRLIKGRKTGRVHSAAAYGTLHAVHFTKRAVRYIRKHIVKG
ncbi:MAG: hypothetical protein IIY73_00535 [Solobacterium sp.]|nr:hypothetical protein [Solobacterium sp.]MBQ1446422.1 hypothetical protein [Solobacterium sp.]